MLHPVEGCGELEPNTQWERGDVHPGKVTNPPQGQHKDKRATLQAHSHTKSHFESPAELS